MEDLTRSQYILLVLFVAFFSATVSGIVVVSILERAPKDVTRVIQKTVIQTVEKVVPKEPEAKIITQEKRVVVSEADTIKNAIAKAKPSIARIFKDGVFLGAGVVVSSDGLVLSSKINATGDNFVLKTDSGEYTAKKVKDTLNFSYFKIDSDTIPKPISILTKSPVLGSKVVLIIPGQVYEVSDGIISSYTKDSVITTIRHKKPIPGSVLISSSGALVSILKNNADAQSGIYIAPEIILKEIETLNIEEKAEDETKNKESSKQDNTSSSSDKTII